MWSEGDTQLLAQKYISTFYNCPIYVLSLHPSPMYIECHSCWEMSAKVVQKTADSTQWNTISHMFEGTHIPICSRRSTHSKIITPTHSRTPSHPPTHTDIAVSVQCTCYTCSILEGWWVANHSQPRKIYSASHKLDRHACLHVITWLHNSKRAAQCCLEAMMLQ